MRVKKAHELMDKYNVPRSKEKGNNTTFLNQVEAFVFHDIYNLQHITPEVRELAIIAANTALRIPFEVEAHADIALQIGVAPEKIREVIYRVSGYAGIGVTLEALMTFEKVLKKT